MGTAAKIPISKRGNAQNNSVITIGLGLCGFPDGNIDGNERRTSMAKSTRLSRVSTSASFSASKGNER
jgi:hypothetical protein